MNSEDETPNGWRDEQLLSGTTVPDPDSLEQVRLGALGEALRRPALDSELLGLDAAVAAFQAHAAKPVSRWRRPTRTATVAAAGIATILVVGGVAAAATGTLPAPLQRFAHSTLGLPGEPTSIAAGDTHSSATDSAAPDPDSSTLVVRSYASGAPSLTASPAGSTLPTPSAGSVGNSARGLCVAWRSHGKPVDPNSAIVRGLIPLVGASGIQVFCANLLSTTPSPTATVTVAPGPPAHPGGGHPGPKVHPAPTPLGSHRPKK